MRRWCVLAMRCLVILVVAVGPRAQLTKSLARVEGDFIVGALFSVHYQPARGTQGPLACGEVRELYGIQRVETALWTLDDINSRTEILRGVTLGLEARDSCWYSPVALQQSIELVRDAITPTIGRSATTDSQEDVSSQCPENASVNLKKKAAPVIGVVGPGASSVTLQVQNLLQLFAIPQVGYSSTSRDLSDKNRYSTFLRVVPSDYHQAKLLVDLVKNFNWTYVSIVSTDENYGTSGIQAFRELAENKSVCIAREDSILTTASDAAYDKVISNLNQDPAANVVVCFCEGLTVRHLIEASKRLNLTDRFLFVGSDGWADRDDVVQNLEAEAWGSISIRIHSPYVPDFDRYYLALRPHNNTRNPWFKEFWQFNFNCTLPPEPGTLLANKPPKHPPCTGKEKITPNKHKQDPKMSFVMKSFWVMAHGLHHMLQEICGLNYTGVCKEMSTFNGTRFWEHLINVTFSFHEELVEFDSKGDPPGRYEVLNYQRLPNGTYAYVQIGEWSHGTLTFTSSPQYRNFNPVTSVCSKPCNAGEYKNFQTGGQEKKCCWACTNCTEYQYTTENQTKCENCKIGQKPTQNRTACEDVIVEYMLWNDVEALVAMTSAGIGLLATCVTCHIFIRHNDTPVVKASTRELSYLILAGMACSHVSILPILAMPDYTSCTLSRLMPGISFAMIYASLFTKTNRIARILAGSKKRFPKRKPRFMSATSQIVITFLLIAVEVGIATTMLVMEPVEPRSEYPTRERGVLSCGTTAQAVLTPLAFDGLLIGLCTLYAVKTRNVPENFNEAKFIGFAMYTTCVIWIAFVSIYFGSQTEKMYLNNFPPQVLTMCMCVTLSASVTLVFLFAPKLYIIVLRPDRNNRALFTTSKSIRCHIGARVAAAIAEPPPKHGVYRVSESEGTETSSAYRSSSGSSLKRRTLSVQTDKELLMSLCQSLLVNTSPSPTGTKKSSSPLRLKNMDEEYPSHDENGCQLQRRPMKMMRRRRDYSYDYLNDDYGEEEPEEEDDMVDPECEQCQNGVLEGTRNQSVGCCDARRQGWAELDVKQLVDDFKRRSVVAYPSDHRTMHCQSALVQRPVTNGLRSAADVLYEEPEVESRTRIFEEREHLAGDASEDPLLRITITLGSEVPLA
ncbi:metabotropic glutamate receptor 1-like [Copidosoma floridanum]|uniref:metabotropic glutamate receptor 1-like n=1 Tax=Copidosoma floridanum TaxID=29053 RepID=UPI000C6F5EA3|nr:metabotropic glutamate receptor 1-like [Copidosoma floridanum]